MIQLTNKRQILQIKSILMNVIDHNYLSDSFFLEISCFFNEIGEKVFKNMRIFFKIFSIFQIFKKYLKCS